MEETFPFDWFKSFVQKFLKIPKNLAGVVDDIDVDGALILRFDENSIKKILFRRDKHKL